MERSPWCRDIFGSLQITVPDFQMALKLVFILVLRVGSSPLVGDLLRRCASCGGARGTWLHEYLIEAQAG